MSNNLSVLLLTIRPKTLTASLVPIFVATALAISESYVINHSYFIFALLSSVCIQIATNLLNDVIDFKTGADDEGRKGPKRALQLGIVSEAQIKTAAFTFLFFAALFGWPLIERGGLTIVTIGLVSMLMAYAYTGKPFKLAYRGLGDVFVVIFFGLIAVMGMYYLYTLTFSLSAFVAGLQVGFLATVLIAINNARDVEEDKKANKKTLAVRFGAKFVKAEVAVLIFVSLMLGLYWIFIKNYFAALLPLVVLPTAVKLVKNLWFERAGEIYNQFLAQSALIHFLFGIQLSLGLLLPWK